MTNTVWINDEDELVHLRQWDKYINDALDEYKVPHEKGIAILSTWGRVSLVLDELEQLRQIKIQYDELRETHRMMTGDY